MELVALCVTVNYSAKLTPQQASGVPQMYPRFYKDDRKLGKMYAEEILKNLDKCEMVDVDAVDQLIKGVEKVTTESLNRRQRDLPEVGELSEGEDFYHDNEDEFFHTKFCSGWIGDLPLAIPDDVLEFADPAFDPEVSEGEDFTSLLESHIIQ